MRQSRQRTWKCSSGRKYQLINYPLIPGHYWQGLHLLTAAEQNVPLATSKLGPDQKFPITG